MNSVEVNGLSVAYRRMGEGTPVMLIHGWPTSSYLWRDVMVPVAEHNLVIAPDLPGFGRSSKPVDGYDFAFFDQLLDDFLDALGITEVALAAHDLGGPIALHWGLHRPDRLTRLALLNTLVYPEFSATVVDFVRGLLTPSRRERMTSPAGLEEIIRLGVADPSSLGSDVIAAVQAPFQDEDARLALAAAGAGLRTSGFQEIARLLPTLKTPVRIVYGEQDRLLPDIAETFARLRDDVPHAEVTQLPEAGHFVQEDAPDRVGKLLAEFFAGGTDEFGG